MKNGYQGYVDFQISDDYGNILGNDKVEKIVFKMGELEKTYTKDSSEVEYDDEKKSYYVWLTESETLAFKEKIKLEAKVLFDNDSVVGTYISEMYVHPTIINKTIDGDNNV